MMNGGLVPGGSCRSDALRDGGDLGDRRFDLRARLEEHLDHRDAAQRLRLDVLDVVDRRGQRALEGETIRSAISSADMPL